MTEEPVQKASEIRHPNSSMGCGHKDDKMSLSSGQIASFSHQPHQIASTPASKEVWKKGGRMFSILLAVHLVLLACTLVSSGAFEKIAVHDYDVFFLLTVMMLVVIIWIIFYLAGTSRCPDAILCKDCHAGPIWLRGRSSRGAGGEMEGGQFTGKQQLSEAQSPQGTMPCFRRLTPSPLHWFHSQVSLCLQGLLVLHTGFLPSFALALARGLTMLIENPFEIK